jgi:hypothetical protein
MRYPRSLAVIPVVGLVATLMMPSAGLSQTNRPPTMTELLSVLQIHTLRIRLPTQGQWEIRALKPSEILPRSHKPKGLSTKTHLLAMQMGDRDGVFKFTLPQHQGFSQGNFELCKEVSCDGQLSFKWLKTPRCSVDGSQCILIEYYQFGQKRPSAYIALVRVGELSFPASH